MAKFVEIIAAKTIGKFVEGQKYKCGAKLAEELVEAKKAYYPNDKPSKKSSIKND